MKQKFTPADIWEKLGITEHYGGVYATQRLIELCGIKLGQYVLDIGCGTGYTACLLAKKYRANVVSVDINPKILELTKKRIIDEGVSDKVTTIESDAQELTLPANTFDATIAESVLVLCNKKKVSSEMYRVLKPNGVFGDNELTYLKPPPKQLVEFLSESVGSDVRLLQEDEWRAVFRESGFVDVSSAVYTLNPWVQLISHLRVDGARKYISAIVQSISDPTIRGTFFNKDMLKNLSRYGWKISEYLGYGLYMGRKNVI